MHNTLKAPDWLCKKGSSQGYPPIRLEERRSKRTSNIICNTYPLLHSSIQITGDFSMSARFWILDPLLILLSAISLVSLSYGDNGRIVKIYEAEDCAITCAAGSQIGRTIWASGNGRTPDFWGREVGDEVRWTINLPEPRDALKLAIRYSYAHGHYTNFTGASNPARNLELIIDNLKPYPLTVPDTGWWDLFSTTHVPLPPLSKGAHTFRVRSPAPHTTANLDCFIFYEGSATSLPAAFLKTEIATSLSNRFRLRMTAHAQLDMLPEKVFSDFDRIYEHFSEYMGWEPPAPIVIHVIEDKLWDNPGATSYQNQWGVYFMESRMATDQGNWCHEMTHMFYCAHFPWWFDESSVRTLTTFNWMPALFPRFEKPEDNPYYRQCVAEGRAVLENPSRQFDQVEPIQYAIRSKYGQDVFKRFFHLCAEAGRKGELDFTPGHHLTNAEIVKYMSLAAGENVAALYKQWKGF